MKRSALLFLCAAGIGLGLAGCSFSPRGDDAPDDALAGVRWTLERVERNGQAFEPAQDERNQYFVRFGDDGSLRAQNACNECSADYETGIARRLSISSLGCTEMACTPPSPSVPYGAHLTRATRYEVEGDRLRVYASAREGEGRVVLHHRAAN